MSAEVENGKEEGGVKQQGKKKQFNIKEYWPVGIKVLELLVSTLCLGLIYEPASTLGLGKSHMHHIGIMYTAFTGYMVINCVLLISKAIGDRIPYRTVSLFALIGSALCLVTGILLIVDTANKIREYAYHSNTYRLDMMKACIGIAFVDVMLFAADAVLTFKSQNDF
ncbi:hypothetical protein NQ315_001483 [Exocentrus adspersus]|uniref:MARVEL domain-containing protein n=1 Tax=Exocentrus adspersus TaxID=1586481 RepID=A0AAV8W9D5_9CUCU|nr:hypothetical protein NQ315_001483 [Exocentrus adspersus]